VNELALFAGAGGGLLASKLLGWRTVCAVERSEYRRNVLLQRQRDGLLEKFPIWDDVRTFDGLPWRGRVDVVTGGFPCQAFSSAARGNNTAENLWPEMRRIVADVAPRYVFAENVTEAAIESAASELVQMGYTVRAVALGAEDLGADHTRKRYWLRAHAYRDGQLLRTEYAEVAQLPGVFSSIWETYPDESRMADGLAYRLERLAATGDGQVPIVAATAWKTLSMTAPLTDQRARGRSDGVNTP
jgi:DNA (cytosine-5)-methyltransferase 1